MPQYGSLVGFFDWDLFGLTIHSLGVLLKLINEWFHANVVEDDAIGIHTSKKHVCCCHVATKAPETSCSQIFESFTALQQGVRFSPLDSIRFASLKNSSQSKWLLGRFAGRPPGRSW